MLGCSKWWKAHCLDAFLLRGTRSVQQLSGADTEAVVPQVNHCYRELLTLGSSLQTLGNVSSVQTRHHLFPWERNTHYLPATHCPSKPIFRQGLYTAKDKIYQILAWVAVQELKLP